MIIVSIPKDCTGGTVLSEGDQCTGIPLGSPVSFWVEVNSSQCLSSPLSLSVAPVGLGENLTISLETVCSCQCGDMMDNAEECGGRGTLQCGICTCNQGFFGTHCECGEGEGEEEGVENCMGEDGKICSDRGDCKCGVCQCQSGHPLGSIYGTT